MRLLQTCEQAAEALTHVMMTNGDDGDAAHFDSDDHVHDIRASFAFRGRKGSCKCQLASRVFVFSLLCDCEACEVWRLSLV